MKNNNFTIQKLINEAVSQNKEPRKQTSWHASSLGSCLTAAYLIRAGIAKKEFDEKALRVFSAGKMFEDWLIGLLSKGAKKFETQKRIEWKKYNLTGFADLVINGLVYEIKTINSFGFKFLREGGAKEQHKMQLWCYLKCLKKKEGRIIYLEKDTLAVMEFVIKATDPIKEKVEQELAILNRAWEEKLPPSPERDLNNWKARYCTIHQEFCLKQPRYYEGLEQRT